MEFYDSKSDVNHMAALLFRDANSKFPDFEEFMVTVGEEIIKV